MKRYLNWVNQQRYFRGGAIGTGGLGYRLLRLVRLLAGYRVSFPIRDHYKRLCASVNVQGQEI